MANFPAILTLLGLLLLRTTRSATSFIQRRIPLLLWPNNQAVLSNSILSRRVAVHRASQIALMERLRGGDQKDDDTSDHEEEPFEDAQENKDDDEEDEEDEEEGEDEEDDTARKKNEARLSTPVKVVIQTKLSTTGPVGSSILDQKVITSFQRRRTVAKIKESLRKMLPNKPPISLMQIVQEGRVLSDDTLVDEILEDEDEDDDEEEDLGEDEDGEGTLHLVLDMIPPVDAKFAPSMLEQLEDVTTLELLRLYASNEAALHATTLSLHASPKAASSGDMDDDDDEEEEDEEDDEEPAETTTAIRQPVVPQLKEHADQIESELKDMLLLQSQAGPILEETRPPSAIQAVTEIRGERVQEAVPSRGVKTSLRRKVQHTFNVQSWPDTIRYICLFVFFGIFGGRTPMSRLILLLGAPSVLVLQARPVKIFWKQLLYSMINDPPGILLSLLPAPQQALFRQDPEKDMLAIYGSYTDETKDIFEASAATKKKRRIVEERRTLNGNEEEGEDDEFFDAREEEDDDDEDEEDDDDKEEEEEEEDDDDDDNNDDNDSDEDDSDGEDLDDDSDEE